MGLWTLIDVNDRREQQDGSHQCEEGCKGEAQGYSTDDLGMEQYGRDRKASCDREANKEPSELGPSEKTQKTRKKQKHPTITHRWIIIQESHITIDDHQESHMIIDDHQESHMIIDDPQELNMIINDHQESHMIINDHRELHMIID
jgi:hypothetical protein